VIYALLVGFWPVWVWYVQRLLDKSDEPLGIVALLTLAVMLFLHKERLQQRSVSWPLFIILLFYFVSLFVAAKLFSALLAMLAVGLFLSGGKLRQGLTMGDWCLLFLSLPVVASLNFYLGYPLRLAVTSAAVPLLNINGFAAVCQGTSISWAGQVIEIDAPCSGIRMLWAALYLAATLASLRGFNIKNGLLFMTLSVVAALVANVLRVTSLFYLETGTIALPPNYNVVVHEGVGVAVFFMLAIGLLYVATRIGRSQQAAETSLECEAEPEPPLVPALEPASAPLKKSIKHSYLAACALCALTSIVLDFGAFASGHKQSPVEQTLWPQTFEGQPLRPVPLSQTAAEFSEGFPGAIAIFTAGNRTVVYRHIDRATRQLHPAADCYRAAGYQIKYLPLFTDKQGQRWETIEASRGGERLQVRERIYDDGGKSWTDVSAWYWSAVCGQSRGPWWSVAVSRLLE